jgi:pimeloyl-ACP methyl ester carboxylesterase
VVLLHGFPEGSESWEGVVPALWEAGYRTLVPDQRGYSPRARPAGRRAYRVRELVGDVIALADQAGVGRFHLVGHDWGAAVAWAAAALQPQRLRTLTSLSIPHPAAFQHAALTSAQGLRSWYMAFFQLPVIPEALISVGDWRYLRRFLVGSGLSDDFADRYIERLRHPGALTAALNWYRALQPFSGGRLGPVSTPTLLVWGTDDRFVHSAGVHATARYVAGPYRLEILEGVSHWIPEEVPARVASLLLSHLTAA